MSVRSDRRILVVLYLVRSRIWTESDITIDSIDLALELETLHNMNVSIMAVAYNILDGKLWYRRILLHDLLSKLLDKALPVFLRLAKVGIVR